MDSSMLLHVAQETGLSLEGICQKAERTLLMNLLLPSTSCFSSHADCTLPAEQLPESQEEIHKKAPSSTLTDLTYCSG